MRSWLMIPMIALLGCERGCLSKRLAATEDVGLPMQQIDCPDGLARCVDGRLERSRLATTSGAEPCPWTPLGECEGEGECVEGVMLSEEHARQLCRTADSGAIFRTSPAGADDCHDTRWECEASRVFDCSGTKQVV